MKRHSVDHAHGDGTARLDRHAPEHQLADALDARLDVILLAGGDAAGGQDQVVACRPPRFSACRELVAVVAQDAEIG